MFYVSDETYTVCGVLQRHSLLTAYVLSRAQLSKHQIELIEVHLAECEHCRFEALMKRILSTDATI